MEPLQYEARGYLKEPFRLFHLADGRGEYIEYHYHTFHKIIILLAGKASYAVEGERYELAPGDFVLVGSGSIHRPVVETGDYYERMILYIAPDYLRALTVGDCDPSECFRQAQETFQYVYRDEGGSRVRPLGQALAETAHTALTSERIWELRITVCFCFRPLIRSRISMICFGSSPTVGSSRMITSGYPRIACARPTLWR